jgi:hypothetical protein
MALGGKEKQRPNDQAFAARQRFFQRFCAVIVPPENCDTELQFFIACRSGFLSKWRETGFRPGSSPTPLRPAPFKIF